LLRQREDAEAVVHRFGGEHFDLVKDRGKRKRRHYWSLPSSGLRKEWRENR
jgi:hypothetical protein